VTTWTRAGTFSDWFDLHAHYDLCGVQGSATSGGTAWCNARANPRVLTAVSSYTDWLAIRSGIVKA
jgi:hypothetical protein